MADRRRGRGAGRGGRRGYRLEAPAAAARVGGDRRAGPCIDGTACHDARRPALERIPAPSSASASASGSPGPATGAAVVATTGTPVLKSKPRKNDYEPDMWDLDVNRDVSSTFVSVYGKKVDSSLTSRTLGAENGGAFAAWTGQRPPTLADCGTQPPDSWVPSVAQEQLARGTTECVRTDEERFGWRGLPCSS